MNTPSILNWNACDKRIEKLQCYQKKWLIPTYAYSLRKKTKESGQFIVFDARSITANWRRIHIGIYL